MWITLQRSLFLVMREGFEGFVQDAPLEELRCAIKEAETGLDVSVFELVCARLTCALATLLRGETESGAVAALDATGGRVRVPALAFYERCLMPSIVRLCSTRCKNCGQVGDLRLLECGRHGSFATQH